MTTVGPTVPVTSSPVRRRAWAAKAALAALALAVLGVACESVWLPPLVRQVVRHRSGRTIDFSALHLGLDRRLQPRVGFDDLTVENAAWATSREPLIRGRKVVFEFDWQGLTTGIWHIRRLVLEDAEVDLERRADGVRNSRLWHPDGTGPARTRVLRIDARRSRLRYADAVTGLQLQIASEPLAAPQPLAGHPGLTLTQRLSVDGRRGGMAFSGAADVGDVITLQRTGETFPLQGELRAENIRIAAKGLVGDLLVDGRVDAALQLGVEPHAGRRAAPFGGVPPALRLTGAGHLRRDGPRWAVSDLRLRSAHSEAVGTIDYRRADAAGGRAALHAAFDAQRLDLHELRPTAEPPAAAAPGPAPAGSLDAEIDLHVARLDWDGTDLAREARLHASLDHDRLGVRLTEARIAEGRASGEGRLDLGASAPGGTLDLHLSGLQLDRLPRRRLGGPLRAGRLDGRAVLRAQGRSPAELLASAAGRVEASLHGATVSKRLEAELGLDGIGLLRSLIGGSEQVPLRCAELVLDVRQGIGTVHRLALDTPRTAVSGRGSVDLARRSVDLVLSPNLHGNGLFALPRDIHVEGRLDAPKWSLQGRAADAAPQRCGAG